LFPSVPKIPPGVIKHSIYEEQYPRSRSNPELSSIPAQTNNPPVSWNIATQRVQ
jgi:hypothetical protein